ncbi:MAG: antitoxin family protein [Chloroflexi bacterium]|nr:antitoxin family protein [Chloroflexota bacterium]
MTTSIKARYANGVLTPLDPLDLDEGCEVLLTVEQQESAPRSGLGGIADFVKELHESMPPDAWDDLPTDLAQNKKHYLYGHPKE